MSTSPALPAAASSPEAGEDSAKVRQILDGASKVFLSLGFDGASMGDIARMAGVSKGTLYVYFENKAELFSALVAEERRINKRDFGFDLASTDVAGELRRYGATLLPYISRERNIQLVRTVMAIAEKFAKVGQDFYRDGPGRGVEHLSSFIAAHASAGRLVVADTRMAALQLQHLFHAGIVNELLYGVRDAPDGEEIARVVDEAVATFMARYGARGAATS